MADEVREKVIRIIAEQAGKNTVYMDTFIRSLEVMENDEKNGPPPVEVAHLLEKILQHPSPGLRYPVGKMSDRFSAGIKAFLPGKAYEWMVMKTYKLR